MQSWGIEGGREIRECRVGGLRGDKKQESARCFGIFFTPEAPLRIGANFTFKAPSPHTLEASAEPRSVDEGDVLSKDDEELEEASEQSEHGANED